MVLYRPRQRGGAGVEYQNAGTVSVDEVPGHVRVCGIGGHRGEGFAEFRAHFFQPGAIAAAHQHGTMSASTAWPLNSPIVPPVQAHWYKAVCRAVLAEHIGGVYWWEVSFDADPAHPAPFQSDGSRFLAGLRSRKSKLLRRTDSRENGYA